MGWMAGVLLAKEEGGFLSVLSSVCVGVVLLLLVCCGVLRALFLLGQLVPVVALAATDGMAGMACCKHGRDSCCRRKPMGAGPSVRAGHPCGMACAGTPVVAVDAGVAVMAPLASIAWLDAVDSRVFADGPAVVATGYDAARFQRPPPDFV